MEIVVRRLSQPERYLYMVRIKRLLHEYLKVSDVQQKLKQREELFLETLYSAANEICLALADDEEIVALYVGTVMPSFWKRVLHINLVAISPFWANGEEAKEFLMSHLLAHMKILAKERRCSFVDTTAHDLANEDIRFLDDSDAAKYITVRLSL